MGQAAVDLPDPLEPPPATSAAGTDDLLAQLAGEEIDRLLAEAEVERPSAPVDEAPPSDDDAGADVTTTVPVPPPAKSGKSQASTPPAAATPSRPSTAAPAPIVIAPTVAQPEARELTPASKAAFAKLSDGAAARVERDESTKLGQVLRELEADPAPENRSPKDELPAAAAAPVPAAPPVRAEARAEAETVAAAAAVEQSLASQTPGLLAELEEEERLAKAAQTALAAPAGDAATASDDSGADPSDDLAAVLDGDDDAASLPIYLKPLAWINAPLDACSDSVRQAIGKVAIITLVNAVAVFLYVLIFRRG